MIPHSSSELKQSSTAKTSLGCGFEPSSILSWFVAKKMSELNATAQVPEEIVDAQAADGPECKSEEIGSNPSLPSIDTQRGDVIYTSFGDFLRLTEVLE